MTPRCFPFAKLMLFGLFFGLFSAPNSSASDASGSCIVSAISAFRQGPYTAIEAACITCKGAGGTPQDDKGGCRQGAVGWCYSQSQRCENNDLGCTAIPEIWADCTRRNENDAISSAPRPFSSNFNDHEITTGGLAPSTPDKNNNKNDTPTTAAGSPKNQQQCNNALRAAEACCSNPHTCVQMPDPTRGSGESIPQWCARISNELNNGGNNRAAAACSSKMTDCNRVCGGNNPSCNSFESLVNSMGRQSISSSVSAEYAQQCKQNSQQQPQNAGRSPVGDSGGGADGRSPTGMGGGEEEAAQAAARQAMERAFRNKPQGTAEFKQPVAESGKASGFDVADTGRAGTQSNTGQFAGNTNGENTRDKIKGGGGTNGTIANNTGGQVPGSGDSGGGAKLGGGRGTGSPGSPGYTTDVLHGFQGASGGGGNGSAAGGGSTDVNSDASGFSGYGGGRGTASDKGMDLKQYLPGGRRDPGARLGGFKPFSTEINGPHVNIWDKISDRFQEKCRLGELFDCR